MFSKAKKTTGSHIAKFFRHHVSPMTVWLASLSEDGWVILWEAGLEPTQVLQSAEAGFSCQAWHPQGQYLAIRGQQGELLIYSSVYP